MRLMHLNCLRKAITKSVSFSNLQVKKCLKEKLTVTMTLDHTVAFHDLDGLHQHTNLSHPLWNFTGSEFQPRHSCLYIPSHTTWNVCVQSSTGHFSYDTEQSLTEQHLNLLKKKAMFTSVEIVNATVVLLETTWQKWCQTPQICWFFSRSPMSRIIILQGLNALLILRMWNVMRKGKCIK